MPHDLKTTVLFLFGYGSEVRQFIYSGFVDELSKHFRVVIAARIISENMLSHAKKHGYEVIELVYSEPNRLQAYVFGKADACFYRAFNSKEKFSYFGKIETSGRKRKLSTICRCMLPVVNWVERLLFSMLRNKETDRFLKAINPNLLIVNLPRSRYFLRTLYQASRLGIRTCLIFNTLKEIDANGRINMPIDRYFTWNAASSDELLKYNQHIKPMNVCAVGSTYYDNGRSCPGAPRKTHVLYCAANPKSLPNEVDFVERLFIRIQNAGLLENTDFIVRPNPMDDDFSRWHSLSTKIGVTIKVPKWIWRPVENWNEALAEDSETYLSLLRHAKCVIGAASTVAIDAVVAGTPFLCIAANFWPDEIPHCNFSYFSTAENFKLIQQSSAVFCPKTFDEMVGSFHAAENLDVSQVTMPAVIIDPKETAGQRIVRELIHGVA